METDNRTQDWIRLRYLETDNRTQDWIRLRYLETDNTGLDEAWLWKLINMGTDEA